jgi:hypothetical protein
VRRANAASAAPLEWQLTKVYQDLSVLGCWYFSLHSVCAQRLQSPFAAPRSPPGCNLQNPRRLAVRPRPPGRLTWLTMFAPMLMPAIYRHSFATSGGGPDSQPSLKPGPSSLASVSTRTTRPSTSRLRKPAAGGGFRVERQMARQQTTRTAEACQRKASQHKDDSGGYLCRQRHAEQKHLERATNDAYQG